MSLLTKIWEFLGGKAGNNGETEIDISEPIPVRKTSEAYYKILAINCCCNMIADTLLLGEFKTYEKGKQTNKSLSYMLNVEPNKNDSASEFWRKAIRRLIYENECLIVMSEKGRRQTLHIADSFVRAEYAFKDNEYSGITIAGLSLNKTYKEGEVLYLQLNDKNINNIIMGAAKSMEELIAYSQKNYKRKNATRATIEMPTRTSETPEEKEKQKDLMAKRFKGFYEAENGAVMPLTNDMKYTEMPSVNSASNNTRDIRALVDDIFYFTALGFNIPPILFQGQVADTSEAMNTFVNLRIRPLGKLISTEIIRKLYGEGRYQENSYVKLDTSMVKSQDLKDIANAADIMFRTGAHTINDNRQMLGMEKFDDPIADEIFVTKNYQRIAEIENTKEGGGEKLE